MNAPVGQNALRCEIMHGDRVRLTRDAAATRMKCRRRNRRIDWYKRRGIVVNIGEFTDSIGVRWDGCTYADQWPRRALERVQ